VSPPPGDARQGMGASCSRDAVLEPVSRRTGGSAGRVVGLRDLCPTATSTDTASCRSSPSCGDVPLSPWCEPMGQSLSTTPLVTVPLLSPSTLSEAERAAWTAALSLAPGSNRCHCASVLLDVGVTTLRVSPWPMADGDSGSLLHVAAEVGDVELIRLFLSRAGPAIASIVDGDGQTALHVAVSHGHLDAARTLVVESETGMGCAQLLLCDKYRMTPFHLACEGGDAAMVEMVLEQLAAQPMLSEEAVAELKRGSAVFLARRGNHKEVVSMLESLRDSPRSGPSSPPFSA